MKKIFLDLRSERFNLGDETIFLSLMECGLIFQVAFDQVYLKLYEGFYEQKDDVFEKGLINIKLIDESDSEEIKNEMKKLFSAHFGEALNSVLNFSMSDFQDIISSGFFIFVQTRKTASI